MRLLLAATALMLVLSGCASPSDGTKDADTPALVDAGDSFLPPGELTDLPRMRFGFPEYDQTTDYPGSFPVSSTCTPFAPCEEQIKRIDVTSQIPSDAPVEFTATV